MYKVIISSDFKISNLRVTTLIGHVSISYGFPNPKITVKNAFDGFFSALCHSWVKNRLVFCCLQTFLSKFCLQFNVQVKEFYRQVLSNVIFLRLFIIQRSFFTHVMWIFHGIFCKSTVWLPQLQIMSPI